LSVTYTFDLGCFMNTDPEMTFCPTKDGNSHNLIMLFIWANQKTESFVYRWLCTHAVCQCLT